MMGTTLVPQRIASPFDKLRVRLTWRNVDENSFSAGGAEKVVRLTRLQTWE